MERAASAPSAEDAGGGGKATLPGRRLRQGLIGAGIAAGLTLAGLGVAAGQSDTTTTTAPPTGSQAPAPEDGRGPRGGRVPGGGKHGFGMGIHGEFTTRAPAGGYQTMATQVGHVTAVNETSVTVRSEDGYSRTYAVDDGTLVNAGNNGISDVRQDDQVRVLAIVRDGNATAVDISDQTQVRRLREQWAPAPPRTPQDRRAPGDAPD